MATMLTRFKKVEGREVIVKIGREQRTINDGNLARAIEDAYEMYNNARSIESALKEVKRAIAAKAKGLIDDRGTVTFIVENERGTIECKVTFQYEAIIPQEHVEYVKEILGERFSDLVKMKTTYIATPKLIEFAVDADRGKELAEAIVIREKAVQFNFRP